MQVLISKMQTMKETVNPPKGVECGRYVSHLIYLLMSLQYDKKWIMICTFILERDLKAYNVVGREKERRKGMEDGVFDVPYYPRLEI